MANTSLEVDDELLEEVDNKILEKKYKNEFPSNASRSRVLRELMRMWVNDEITVELDTGNPNIPAMTAD